MVRRSVLTTGLLVLLWTGVSFAAADLNGRWEGSINTPNGDVDLVFQFKVSGAVLTGTVETPNGNANIADGKIDGEKFSFKTSAGDSEINHEGTVSGDTIHLKVSGPWGDTDMTLKRAAEGKSAKP